MCTDADEMIAKGLKLSIKTSLKALSAIVAGTKDSLPVPGRPVSQSLRRSVSQSVAQSVSRSVSQSWCRYVLVTVFHPPRCSCSMSFSDSNSAASTLLSPSLFLAHLLSFSFSSSHLSVSYQRVGRGRTGHAHPRGDDRLQPTDAYHYPDRAVDCPKHDHCREGSIPTSTCTRTTILASPPPPPSPHLLHHPHLTSSTTAGSIPRQRIKCVGPARAAPGGGRCRGGGGRG